MEQWLAHLDGRSRHTLIADQAFNDLTVMWLTILTAQGI